MSRPHRWNGDTYRLYWGADPLLADFCYRAYNNPAEVRERMRELEENNIPYYCEYRKIGWYKWKSVKKFKGRVN